MRCKEHTEEQVLEGIKQLHPLAMKWVDEMSLEELRYMCGGFIQFGGRTLHLFLQSYGDNDVMDHWLRVVSEIAVQPAKYQIVKELLTIILESNELEESEKSIENMTRLLKLISRIGELTQRAMKPDASTEFDG